MNEAFKAVIRRKWWTGGILVARMLRGGRWSSANSKNINILQQGAKRIKGTELKHADCGGLCVQ